MTELEDSKSKVSVGIVLFCEIHLYYVGNFRSCPRGREHCAGG